MFSCTGVRYKTFINKWLYGLQTHEFYDTVDSEPITGAGAFPGASFIT